MHYETNTVVHAPNVQNPKRTKCEILVESIAENGKVMTGVFGEILNWLNV